MIDWLASALLGASVGWIELLSRYKDEPVRLLAIGSAHVYASLNSAGSLAALYAIHVFAWDFGATDPGASRVLQVLLSGVGGMAVLRSSLFNLKIGNSVVPVGPSVMLITLLAVADNGVRRARVRRRAPLAQAIMKGISFQDTGSTLVSYCVRLMQNLADEDEKIIRKGADSIARENLADSHKSVLLGLLLLDYLGPDALEAAVGLVREDAVPPS